MTKKAFFPINEKLVLGRTVFTPPFEVSQLSLENEARIVYVMKGHSILHTPTNTIKMSTGDCVVINSNKLINKWLINEDNSDSVAIIFRLFPEILRHIYQNHLPPALTQNNARIEPISPAIIVKGDPLFGSFFMSLDQYMDRPDLMTPDLVGIKLMELLKLMTTPDHEEVIPIFQSLFKHNENEFAEVIESHLFEDLSIDQLAFLTNMSASSFKRKFREIFNESPIQFIKRRRLEHAKYLLETTASNISEVAFQSGFNDRSYFTKSFTSHFSISPTDYKNSL